RCSIPRRWRARNVMKAPGPRLRPLMAKDWGAGNGECGRLRGRGQGHSFGAMDSALATLDFHAARALLDWQAELGAAEAIGDLPLNRFEAGEIGRASCRERGEMWGRVVWMER